LLEKFANRDDFFLDLTADHLYEQRGNQWLKYTRLPGKTRTLMYHSNPWLIQEGDKPNNPHYAKIHNNGLTIILKGAAPINRTLEDQPKTKVEGEWGIQIKLEGQEEETVIKAIWQGIAVELATDHSKTKLAQQCGQSKVQQRQIG